jgi:hypothetical protein
VSTKQKNQNAHLHVFLPRRPWYKLVVVVVGGGGVDIAADNNGVLTLGGWLFACVARPFVSLLVCLALFGFVRSFVPLFVRSFARSWGWWC